MASLVHFVVLTMVVYVVAQENVLQFSITEESPPVTFIGNIVAEAKLTDFYSSDVLSNFEYDFVPQPNQDVSFFTMDKSDGIIRTSTTKLDRESVCNSQDDECFVEVDVAIVKPVDYFQVYTARIQIIDINDNAPDFPQSQIQVKFSESAPFGSTIGLPLAVDPDSAKLSVKRYELSEGKESGLFELVTSEKNGVKLRLKGLLDRELVSEYRLTVTAFDGGNPSLSGSVTVQVLIEDANDHQPVFSASTYTVDIDEDFAINTSIVQVSAKDADSGVFGKIKYQFTTVTTSQYSGLFDIDPDTGDIILKTELDYEKTKQYSLDVLANDGGFDSLTPAQTTVVINILDVNDNAPMITIRTLGTTEAGLSELAPLDTFVAHISVFDADKDQNGQVTCGLDSNLFRLQSSSSNNRYKLVSAAAFDREVQEKYIITVQCEDHGQPAKIRKQELTVIVQDENDHVPVFSKNMYMESILENSPIGKSIIQVTATDRDAGDNAKITYKISAGVVSQFISVDSETGVISTTSNLDYESTKEIKFEVIATDGGSLPKSSTAMVTLTILDQNDNAPQFTQPRYSFSVREGEPIGTVVDTLTAVDLDSSQYNQFHYVIQDSQDAMYFIADPDTGVLITQRPLDREMTSSHHLTVHAVDAIDKSLVSTAFVDILVEDINDNYPQIHYPSGDNNTVYISNSVPTGYTILKVQVTDADMGHNANLSYAIINDDDKAFKISPTTGILVTNVRFNDIDEETIEVTILVSDSGQPAKANTTKVNIVVDSTIAYAEANEATFMKQSNLTIIIIVAAVSGLIVIILLIAIVLLKTVGRHKNPQERYLCSIEPQKQHGKDADKKGVSFYIDAEEQNKQVRPMCQEVVKNVPTKSSNVSFEGPFRHHLQFPNDADTSSASSGEFSVADSGHGASDEGGRDSPAPVIPPRVGRHVNRRNHYPQHQQAAKYPGYTGTGKPPCKVHSFRINANQSVPHSSNVAYDKHFGDRSRDVYYKDFDDSRSRFSESGSSGIGFSGNYSIQDLPDPIQIVPVKDPQTDLLYDKGMIV